MEATFKIVERLIRRGEYIVGRRYQFIGEDGASFGVRHKSRDGCWSAGIEKATHEVWDGGHYTAITLDYNVQRYEQKLTITQETTKAPLTDERYDELIRKAREAETARKASRTDRELYEEERMLYVKTRKQLRGEDRKAFEQQWLADFAARLRIFDPSAWFCADEWDENGKWIAGPEIGRVWGGSETYPFPEELVAKIKAAGGLVRG